MKFPKKDKLSPALDAIDQNNISKLLKILPKVKNINDLIEPVYGEKTTLLCRAAQIDQVEIIKLLLRHNADVNTPNEDGVFPIQLASEMNNIEVTKLLLDNGSKLNFFGNGTALHTASSSGHTEIMKLFINNVHVDIDQQDDQGNTCLHSAVLMGHIDACKLLLKSGVKMNTQNHEGNTALHLSCKRKQVSTTSCIETTRLLLEHGAQMDLKNNHGKLAENEVFDSKLLRLFSEHRKQIVIENSEKYKKKGRSDSLMTNQKQALTRARSATTQGNLYTPAELDIPQIQITTSTPTGSPQVVHKDFLRRTRSATDVRNSKRRTAARSSTINDDTFRENNSSNAVNSNDVKNVETISSNRNLRGRNEAVGSSKSFKSPENNTQERVDLNKADTDSLKQLQHDIELKQKEEESLENEIKTRENDLNDLRFRLQKLKQTVKRKVERKEKIESQHSVHEDGFLVRSIQTIRQPMKMITRCFGHV